MKKQNSLTLLSPDGQTKKEIVVRLVASGLKGSAAIDLLRKGHMVRQSTWLENAYIRITNEDGFDANGNAVKGRAAIYTLCTNGYFCHIGFTEPPLAGKYVTRDSEGLSCFFEDNWEDWGFVSAEDFDILTELFKDGLRKKQKKQHDNLSRHLLELQGYKKGAKAK